MVWGETSATIIEEKTFPTHTTALRKSVCYYILAVNGLLLSWKINYYVYYILCLGTTSYSFHTLLVLLGLT